MDNVSAVHTWHYLRDLTTLYFLLAYSLFLEEQYTLAKQSMNPYNHCSNCKTCKTKKKKDKKLIVM